MITKEISGIGGPIRISKDVQTALNRKEAVVSLETAVLTHGLPHPHNVEIMNSIIEEIEGKGAVPCVIGVIDGVVRAGLNSEEISILGSEIDVKKISSRDLPAVLGLSMTGGTTVSSTAFISRKIGIDVMATGGIGGVHRDQGGIPDISLDLLELSRTDLIVVCSGPKSILDLRGTYEALETMGVQVVGYGTDEMPAFLSRSSGIDLEWRVDDPSDVSSIFRSGRKIGYDGSLLVMNPIPQGSSMDHGEMDDLIDGIIEKGVPEGKNATPYILGELSRKTGMKSVDANRDLLIANASLAADIALDLTNH